jgi:hypothetical protein
MSFDLTIFFLCGIINCNKPKNEGFIDEQIVEKALFFCGQGKYDSYKTYRGFRWVEKGE